LRLPDRTGVVGQVVHTGHVRIVDDVRQDPAWHAGPDDTSGFRTKNLLCVPLNAPSGERLGALEVMNKSAAFTPDDVMTLESLASQAAIVLGNVREHEALVRT